MAEPREALVFIVSGPSGSGKSTLVKKLLELPGMMWSVSCTTRPPRPGEAASGWYNFISEPEFLGMVERGEFLEYARVFGRHWYGTPQRWLEEARSKGLDLVLEIDVQGAMQVKKKLPEAIAILILPPTRQELERRIRVRGQDTDEEIVRRLERARQELLGYKEYDYVVINDDLNAAGCEIQTIARAARCRTQQNEGRIRKILETFGG